MLDRNALGRSYNMKMNTTMAGLSSSQHHPQKDPTFPKHPGLQMCTLSSSFLFKVAEFFISLIHLLSARKKYRLNILIYF